MKQLIAILAFVMVSQANAQYSPSQGQARPKSQTTKRTMIYDERTNELVDVQPEVQTIPAEQNANNPIYIVNSQNQKVQGYQGQSQIQEQPLTIIEDTPLKASAADGMRRKRQESEAATEDGIVQALERARIEDEMRRRDRFNSAIGPGGNENSQPTAPAYPSYPPPVAQPAPVQPVIVSPVVEQKDEVDVRSEVRAALNEKYDSRDRLTSYYVSGQVGLAEYPDVINVQGNVATGFSVGAITPERVVAEGTFLYSNYDMEDVRNANGGMYPTIVDLRQYNFDAALKYQLLPGRFRPAIGALASYVRRGFEYNGYQYKTSDSFDMGVTAGADLQLTDSFSLGVDFRYLTNIASRDNTEAQARQSFVYPQMGDKPVEKLDYYTGALTGKFTF